MTVIWIIIGLIILIPISKIDVIPNFLGFVAIFYGLYQIRKRFKYFILTLFPLFLLFIYSLLTFTNNMFYIFNYDNNFIAKFFENDNLDLLFRLFEGRYSIMYGIFALFFYMGIEKQASSIGYKPLAKQAKNLLFLILFFLAITTIPYIKVLPSTIYQVLTHIIIVLEIIVVFTANRLFNYY